MKELIIYGMLIAYLIIGVTIRKKIKNFREYAMGVRPYTKLALSATVVATMFGGGSTIGEVGMAYNTGLIYILTMMCVPIGFLIIPIYILPKLEKYYGCISLPEIIERNYGSSTRRYAGSISYIWLLGALAMQVKALSVLFSNIFNYEGAIGASLAFIIMMIYTSLRGVYGVIKTDIIQFFLFVIIFPIIIFFLLKENGGSVGDLISMVEKENYIKNISLVSIVALSLEAILPSANPMFVHRMLIGRDGEKNRVAVNAFAVISILSIFMVAIIVSIAFINNINEEGGNIIFTVIKNFLNNELYYALFGAGLIAVIISTTDSILNTASVVFVNDIIKEEKKKNVINAQIICIVTGLIALITALIADSVLEIILFFGQLYSSALFIPFFLGLYFKKRSPLMFWSSSLSGVGSYLFLYICFPELGYTRFLLSITISLLSYFIAYKNIWSLLIAKIANINFSSSMDDYSYIKKLRWYILPITISIILSEFTNKELSSVYIEMTIVVMNLFLFLSDLFISD